jgi:hypothetical protein
MGSSNGDVRHRKSHTSEEKNGNVRGTDKSVSEKKKQKKTKAKTTTTDGDEEAERIVRDSMRMDAAFADVPDADLVEMNRFIARKMLEERNNQMFRCGCMSLCGYVGVIVRECVYACTGERL